jgi:transcriptional regulator with GAF, ATPase, and Fis domain
VRFLVRRFSVRIGKRIDAVSHETMQRLLESRWPGNVRELENVVERAVILTTGEVLEIDSALLPASAPVPAAPAPIAPASAAPGAAAAARGEDPTSMKDVERKHIQSVLERTNWVIEGDRGAARALNLHPNTLRSRMKKLGITRPGEKWGTVPSFPFDRFPPGAYLPRHRQ